jgi:uncharacterized protein involved in exopolysaccharide biosynthesis
MTFLEVHLIGLGVVLGLMAVLGVVNLVPWFHRKARQTKP